MGGVTTCSFKNNYEHEIKELTALSEKKADVSIHTIDFDKWGVMYYPSEGRILSVKKGIVEVEDKENKELAERAKKGEHVMEVSEKIYYIPITSIIRYEYDKKHYKSIKKKMEKIEISKDNICPDINEALKEKLKELKRKNKKIKVFYSNGPGYTGNIVDVSEYGYTVSYVQPREGEIIQYKNFNNIPRIISLHGMQFTKYR